MENINLFLLRIILTSVILHIATAKSVNKGDTTTESSTTIQIKRKELEVHHTNYPITEQNKKFKDNYSMKKRHKKLKKSKTKREAYGNYGKYWGSKSSNFDYGGYSNNNLPLYLVYNTKIGAYYPYYKYPKENNVRRNGNVRKVRKQ